MLLPASGRKLNLGEQRGQMHLEQLVDLRSGGDGKGSAAGVHAIVLPILRPFLRGLDELTGEAHDVRKSLFNLQAAGQADIDVRLHDGKVARGYTLLPLAFLELVEVDINFAFRHAGEDLNVAGDVLSRITAFPLVSSRRSARAALLLAVNLGAPFGLELLKLSIECLPGRTDARVAVNHALLSVISFGNRNSPKVS
jgi:hypothetical protein